MVTAEDRTTNQTSIVTVNRQPPPPSANADLASLTLSEGTLNPAFDPATQSYKTSVPERIKTLRVTPTPADAAASAQVNDIAVKSGTPSAPISIPVGISTIAIIVTAEDRTTNQITTIEVNRRDETPPVAQIKFPLPGLTDADAIAVTGTARDAHSEMISVRANGVKAISDDRFATWRGPSVPLQTGLNTLAVETQDAAGNRDAMAASVTVTRNLLSLWSITISIDRDHQRAIVLDRRLDAIFVVDLTTGDRTIVSNKPRNSPARRLSGIAWARDHNRVLAVHRVLEAMIAVDFTTRERTMISDDHTGRGPVFGWPQGIALDRANQRALVLDFSLGMVVAVELISGDRIIISK